MEADGNVWNTLETTVSYKARAWLTPTLTHVVTYELVTSGAEDGTMSPPVDSELLLCEFGLPVLVAAQPVVDITRTRLRNIVALGH